MMTVTQAVEQRKSVRAFKNKPVPRNLVEEILTLAARAPSNSNIQPWKVHALTGDIKSQLSQAVFERAAKSPGGDPADVHIFPPGLGEPWRQRRSDCGERMYSALGIEREDKKARFAQGAKNLTFFDAPVGLIITLDRSLGDLQFLDCGIFAAHIALLAQERDLATCMQAAWSMWSVTIRETLSLSEDEMVLMGISLGYPDTDNVASNIAQPRIELDDYATLHGFG